MMRLAACLLLLVSSGVVTAQPKFSKDGDEIPKSVGKFDGVEVFVQGFVSNSVKLSDWKMGEKGATAIAVWDGRGTTDNIRYDFYDADNVRISGGLVNGDDLVKGEKSRLTFPAKMPAKVKAIKITRQLGG